MQALGSTQAMLRHGPHPQQSHRIAANLQVCLSRRSQIFTTTSSNSPSSSSPTLLATRRLNHGTRTHMRVKVQAAAGSPSGSGGPLPMSNQGMLNDMLAYAYALQMKKAEEERAKAGNGGGQKTGARVTIRDLLFHPPGAERPLLDRINMDVEPNSLGLIIGRSGSGKTTLLQVLAGLCEQTAGSVVVTPGSAAAASATAGAKPPPGARFRARTAAEVAAAAAAGNGVGGDVPTQGVIAAVGPGQLIPSSSGSTTPSSSVLPGSTTPKPGGTGQDGTNQSGTVKGSTLEERMARVGLVFQFPERHFLGSEVFGELTFTWPRDPSFYLQQQELRARVMRVLQAVQLEQVDMTLPPWALSGGQQRRLALAIQLVRQPSLLLLDEPLAGLDWKARAEVVELLGRLKKECTLLVVSHDVREIAPLVDCAWTMKLGGTLEAKPWPPEGGLDSLFSTGSRE